jgi:hypothetical protein
MKAPSFEIAHGTVCGADHLGEFGVPGLSINQDASYSVTLGGVTIAVVSDGCSDRTESAVGAALLCRFFAAAVEMNLPTLESKDTRAFAKCVQNEIVTRIRKVCQLSAPSNTTEIHSVTQVADELFLCTLIGVVLTPKVTVILAAGDGVWSINNKPLQKLGPFPRNEPPYLGYLVRGNHSELSELKVIATCATVKVSTLCIGSDGCDDLPPDFLRRVTSQRATFSNPEFLNRELRKLNSQSVTLSGDSERLKFHVNATWTERSLPDDTTIIVINKVQTPVDSQPISGSHSSVNPALSPNPQAQPSDSSARWKILSSFRNKGSNEGGSQRGVVPNLEGEAHDTENP